MGTRVTRCDRIIETVFFEGFRPGAEQVSFARTALAYAARSLELAVPKNLGGVISTFRGRRDLPGSVRETAPGGQAWVIVGAGRGTCEFQLRPFAHLQPNASMASIELLAATPRIVAGYAKGDEQALLAQVRYNRILDVFLGVACHSLQSHLRTTVPSIGQVEIDELYSGNDKQGQRYIIPVRAKGDKDLLGVVQLEQAFGMCSAHCLELIPRVVATQFSLDGSIVVYLLQWDDGIARLSEERHCRPVAKAE